MVIDLIENYEKYQSLGPRIAEALRYLRRADFAQFETGEHCIAGRDIFAIVSDYPLRAAAEGRLEAHRDYVDIQFLAQGGESIGYAPYVGQQVLSDYDKKGDIAFYAGPSSLLRLEQGMFAIFFPEDLHMPGIGEPDLRVRKVVVKVRR